MQISFPIGVWARILVQLTIYRRLRISRNLYENTGPGSVYINHVNVFEALPPTIVFIATLRNTELPSSLIESSSAIEFVNFCHLIIPKNTSCFNVGPTSTTLAQY